MAYCEWVKFPDGTVAIIRFTGKRPEKKKCLWCDNWGTKLCDYQLPSSMKKKRTCDSPMCDDHAKNIGPNRDLCPEHANRPVQQKGLFT